jgi:hypothetical protein
MQSALQQELKQSLAELDDLLNKQQTQLEELAIQNAELKTRNDFLNELNGRLMLQNTELLKQVEQLKAISLRRNS